MKNPFYSGQKIGANFGKSRAKNRRALKYFPTKKGLTRPTQTRAPRNPRVQNGLQLCEDIEGVLYTIQ